jgi:LytS/YehU family sensor histidine kinase
MWTYLSMSVILLALTYAMDLRERENRISALRTVAQAAQLRALRFQLNPHFLFNALNSVASLISKDRNREAESMTVALSDFLRSTMRMDPEGEIELGEEIAMQSRYLEIEKARFPKRLIVELDVPPELRKAAIPNLISQPLVENAVKYAVARSSAPVTLRIAAWEEDGVLALCVRDDGGDAAQPATGTNIGLSNVSERLRLHFGDAASLVAGPLAGGGYEAVIRVPLRIEG